jgi:uncharacterized protein YbgA (DUF1722 family)
MPAGTEGRLHDPRLRENWVTRVFAYHRLRTIWRRRWTVGDLVHFHTAQKFLLLAHSPQDYRELGRLVAAAKTFSRQELRETYEAQLMAGLSRIATAAKNSSVLEHMLGFFKKDLDKSARQELLDHLQDYRRGLVPLCVSLGHDFGKLSGYDRTIPVEQIKRSTDQVSRSSAIGEREFQSAVQ